MHFSKTQIQVQTFGFTLLFWLILLLFYFAFCCDKTLFKAMLGRKGLIWLTCSDYDQSLGEVRISSQKRSKRYGGILFTALLSMASAVCFLLIPDHLPTIGTTLSHQPAIYERLHGPQAKLMEVIPQVRVIPVR